MNAWNNKRKAEEQKDVSIVDDLMQKADAKQDGVKAKKTQNKVDVMRLLSSDNNQIQKSKTNYVKLSPIHSKQSLPSQQTQKVIREEVDEMIDDELSRLEVQSRKPIYRHTTPLQQLNLSSMVESAQNEQLQNGNQKNDNEQVSVEELLQSELDKLDQEQVVNQGRQAAAEENVDDQLFTTMQMYQNKVSQKKLE